jgi:rSAM/selenodomain-associated transferase 1
MYSYPEAVVMVFCKAPIPGQVKTRLIPGLTGEDAAQLHIELADKTLRTATQNHLCEVQLWCTPSIDHQFFKSLGQMYSVARFVQTGVDLGERMHQAFCQALSLYSSAVIIGCDCPSLTSDDLEQALNRLKQGNSCVLGPAEDGGYVLIGLRQPQPTLFENMPWGTGQVLGLTRTKLQSLDLSYHELSTRWDLDTVDDLRRYRNE